MFTEWWFYTLAGLLGFLMATEWEPLIWVVEKIDRAVHRKERAEKERKEKERKEFVEAVRGMRASDFWWFGSMGDAEVALLWRKMYPPISLRKTPRHEPEVERVAEPEVVLSDQDKMILAMLSGATVMGNVTLPSGITVTPEQFSTYQKAM